MSESSFNIKDYHKDPELYPHASGSLTRIFKYKTKRAVSVNKKRSKKTFSKRDLLDKSLSREN